MKLGKIQKQSFKRALTSKEIKSYEKLISDAKKELEIKDTTAIAFDFNYPSKKAQNTGIGTSFSEAGIDFNAFLKTMFGINSIQLQPQGKITANNFSPYSGTNFAIGEHIIDLSMLATDRYENLLDKEYVENIDKNYKGNKEKREYRVDYKTIFSIQDVALRKAYSNFISNASEKFKHEFSEFKCDDDNKTWLEYESLYEILSEFVYKNPDVTTWSDLDKNLFNPDYKDKKAKEDRIKEIKTTYSEEYNYQQFVQFIADKEQKNSRKINNNRDIKLYGDCLIGFSKSEMWGNRDCFIEDEFYGGLDPACSDTNGIQTWNLPALNYDKIGFCDGISTDGLLPAGKLLYKKYCDFFKRYDGVRMDAAWQFVTPFVYKKDGDNYKQVDTPEINYTILNIVKKAGLDTLKENFNKDNVMLELVGISADESRKLTLNMYPHLYTTAYAQYDETPKKFIEKGYKDGSFYVGVANHDNDSLNNMARDKELRNIHLSGIKRDYNTDCDFGFKTKEYQMQDKEQKTQEDFKTAKLAEIFTTKKQFFTLPDAFGMSERINISGKVSDDNWSIRIPTDYERFYFSQLQNGYGLNLPKVLSCALKMKGKNNNFLNSKLSEAAEILRQEGPTTVKEADVLEQQGKLGKAFEYDI